ncbi:hypothetical protein [Micromonospora sp. KLBMP9576]|uniref:hypothetical protein n=1 Tax=Micromonospora sp. KLBMP9576 TaxID=3424769 RepID=UPI003D8EB35B
MPRCLAVALLVLLEVFMAWRIGQQVFAGLDPNFVRNAWGGPSYLGAMFCHHLDGALLYPICHVLLRWITVPVTPGPPPAGRMGLTSAFHERALAKPIVQLSAGAAPFGMTAVTQPVGPGQ